MDALNLFAYSGLGSLSMAAGGAKVCHLDAARGMIEWGKENLALNPSIPNAIRWIADDVNKFVNRELRRNSKYDLIALDPPTFGRGSSGQLWKIENDLPQLLKNCLALRKDDRPFTLVLSCIHRDFLCWYWNVWFGKSSGTMPKSMPMRCTFRKAPAANCHPESACAASSINFALPCLICRIWAISRLACLICRIMGNLTPCLSRTRSHTGVCSLVCSGAKRDLAAY